MIAKKSPRKTPIPRPAARVPSGVQLGEHKAREMILNGASRVFSERGVRLATVNDILVAAGVSRRTFYRFYESKEEVLVALYQLGTERLVERCRAAVNAETEPLRQFEGCMEAHLRNASELGRLVFVLGGEAQRRESLLHDRRIEVLEILTSLLSSSFSAHFGKPIDPLLVRALILALEGVTRLLLDEGDEGRAVSSAGIDRARRVMKRIASATLAARGPGIAPMPMAK